MNVMSLPKADRAVAGADTFEVFEANAIVTMACACRLGNLPMLIPGVQLVVSCPHCQAQYKILEVFYDAQRPELGVQARVGRRTKAPPPLMPA